MVHAPNMNNDTITDNLIARFIVKLTPKAPELRAL